MITFRNFNMFFACSYFILILFSFEVVASKYESSNTHNAKAEKSMLTIRKANKRGTSQNSWLQSFFTFSFSDYYDPKHMGFKTLRVINEDLIQGGKGFSSHPHKDMEIITYVIQGAIKHKDSMGNETIIRPNEIQRMSAGSGITHSEYNFEKDQATHLYQIWIKPKNKGSTPSYGQKSFEDQLKRKNLVLVASNKEKDGSISVDQDVNVYISRLNKGESLEFKTLPKRHIWIQMVKGKININGQNIEAGDGISTSDQAILKFLASEDNSEFLLFDLI